MRVVELVRATGRGAVASFLLAAAAVLAFVTPSLDAALDLRRDLVLGGEWWRLVTGHLSHASASQLAWNVLAFLALGVAVERLDRRAFLATVGLSTVAVSIAVLLARPDLVVYSGLSGVSSALFAFLAVRSLASRRLSRRAIAIAAAAGGLFLAKLLYESLTGSCAFVPDGGDFEPLPIAHFVGATAGIGVAVLAAGRQTGSTPWEP